MIKCKLASIYMISNGDYYYIGMSVDTYQRWSNHYTDLKLNKHSSTEFQELWNKSKPEDWTWKVLEYISKSEYKKETKLKGYELEKTFRTHLIKRERFYMSKYSINYCLNKDKKYFQ